MPLLDCCHLEIVFEICHKVGSSGYGHRNELRTGIQHHLETAFLMAQVSRFTHYIICLKHEVVNVEFIEVIPITTWRSSSLHLLFSPPLPLLQLLDYT
jgi:hypothetical protein